MRFLVALLLFVAITPGMSEVVEVAAHVVLHGDMPHHDKSAEHEEGCSEHSCTPLAHHCSCHSTMSAQAESLIRTGAEALGVQPIDPTAVSTGLGRAGEPPPVRPPIG